MNFKDFLKESPVGSVGRTSKKDADEHITDSKAGKDFAKMVKSLGGKTVATKLLGMLNAKGQYKLPDGNGMKVDAEPAVPELFESEDDKLKD